DRDETARSRARSHGIDVHDALEETLESADVVLLAVPTSEVAPLLARCAALRPEALFSDCASLKAPVASAAASLSPAVRFVGGHAMAAPGSPPPGAADPAIFRGRPWILVPTSRSDEASIAALSDLVRSLGALPVVLDAGRHDAAMTRVSHLPHVVAAALAAAVMRPDSEIAAGSLAGPGLLDTTRLAELSPALLKELAMADPPALAAAVEEVAAELRNAAESLRRGDEAALDAFFERAGKARARITSRSRRS